MEMAMWQKLILTWVNSCGLLEKPTKFLNQTDLNTFYREYRKLMVTVTIPETDIREFLRAHYPAFKIVLHTEDNSICSEAYIYIYCLLLHYSCVVCTEAIFHEICMKLTATQQELIFRLLKVLPDKDAITRESLECTLRETAAPAAIDFMQMDSPIRTPIRKSSVATPAAKLLEERCRQLISLKANLETERYERTFLEGQMKELEEKLNRANQQQKLYIVEIKQLKEKLLYGDEQNVPQNCEKKDPFSIASHKREVQMLEDKIWHLNNEIENVTRDRNTVQQKNGIIEKELNNFREKYHEQMIISEDIKAELEENLRRIGELESVNDELKMFMGEHKSGKQDLNTTDTLDYSFNSSRTGESPENLAQTVVDVQLREKELENQTLRNTLAAKQEECFKLSREIVAFMEKHSDDIDVSVPKIVCADDNLQYVTFSIMNAMDKMFEKEVEMRKTLEKAVTEQESLVDTIERLNDECARKRMEMNELHGENEKITENFLRVNEHLEKKCQEISNISREFQDICVDLENATKEVSHQKSINARYEVIIEENEATEKELSHKIEQLECKLRGTEDELETLTQKHAVLQKQLAESKQANGEKIDCLKSENSLLNNKIFDLNSSIASLHQSKDHQSLEITQLRDEMKTLRVANDQLKISIESLSFENEELKVEVDTKLIDFNEIKEIHKESQVKMVSLQECMQELKKEISALAADKEELKKNLHKVMEEHNAEKLSLCDNIKEAENQIDDLKNAIFTFEAQEIEFSKQIDALRGEIDMYTADKTKNETNVHDWMKQVDVQRTQMIHLQKEIDCHKLDIDTLRVTLKDKNELMEKTKRSHEVILAEMEKKKCSLEEELTQKETLLHASQENLEKFKQQLQEFQDELQKCAVDQETLQKKYKNLEKTHQKSQAETEKVKEMYEDIAEKMTKATKDLEQFKKIREQIKTLTTSESSDVIKQLEDIHDQIHSKNKALKELDEELEVYKKESSALQEKISQSDEKMKELHKKIQRNSEENDEMCKNHEEELTSLQRALSETYKKNEDLSLHLLEGDVAKKQAEDSLNVLQGEKLTLELKVCELLEETQSLAAKISKEEEAKLQIMEELQSAQNDMIERKTHCAKLVNEISGLKEEHEKTVCVLNEKISQQESKIACLKSENEHFLETTKAQSQELLHKGKDLEEEMKILQENYEVTQKECIDLKDELKKAKEDYTEAILQCKQHEQTLTIKEEEMKSITLNLEQQILAEKSTSATLKNEKECLEKKISDLSGLKENLDKLQDDLTAKDAEISQIQSLLNTKTDNVTQLVDQLDAINKLRHEDQTKFNEEITQLQQNVEEKSVEMSKMEEDRKIVNDSVKELVEKQNDFELKCKQYEERIELLNDSKTKAIDVLQKEIMGLEKRNIDASEKMKLLEGTLCAREKECNGYQEENVKLKEDIESIEYQNDEITQKLLDHDIEVQELQNEIKKLLTAKYEADKHLSKVCEQKNLLEESVVQKDAEIVTIKMELSNRTTQSATECAQVEYLLKEIEKYKCLENDLQKLTQLERKEKELNKELSESFEIFKAKLLRERQVLQEKESEWEIEREAIKKDADERVNENRREMEGKLEKLKEKMKILCNAEIEKMKIKCERDAMYKVDKAESASRKLSKEIAMLNSKQLELVKENTNLRRLMGSTHTLSKAPIPQMNLDMEDEEGEQFNNTYLKDMKYGTDHPFFGRESVTKEELDYRNSMQPPHLKSQYAAQYGNLDDDVMSIGDTNVGDDSMSSLLYAGQRKKVSGTTSYKRPGPPTPSKNGGRLSFGGTADVHPRQILKEINDASKQTPSSTLRTFFSGRKSLAKDETATASPAARFRSIFRNKRTSNK